MRELMRFILLTVFSFQCFYVCPCPNVPTLELLSQSAPSSFIIIITIVSIQVATLSIMGNPELHCDPLLYSLVFGESVLNDAVAIVLFRVFYRYMEGSVHNMFTYFKCLIFFAMKWIRFD